MSGVIRGRHALGLVCGVGLMMNGTAGCLSERSFPMHAENSRRVSSEAGRAAAASTRAWLRAAHGELRDLLPASNPQVLLTEDLTGADGRPTDVFGHFGLRRESLRGLLGNLRGIQYTAQSASREYCIDRPAPSWPGFEDVWIPIKEDLSLNGRLGYARRGGVVCDSDCIVILPGLFGDNGVQRTRDLALFLRDSGLHVLALEMRGHGRTEAMYPNTYYTFGVGETDDLMIVSDWLEELPNVRRTGLMGFCWGANIALLAAWYDGRLPEDPGISSALRPHLNEPTGRRRFAAGVVACSPILRWEVLLDDLDTSKSYFSNPVLAAIQDTVRDRMERKHHPEKSHSLRKLIAYEYEACNIPLPGGALEGYPFIRLMSYKNQPVGPKLENARMPVLIVHGGDDPIAPAQDVADFLSAIDNPLVAAVILPSGGHVGFAAYAPQYYFSLVASFFDPRVGAASGSPELASAEVGDGSKH